MIVVTMTVAAVISTHSDRAEFARNAPVARLVALILDTIIFSFFSAVANAVYGVTQVTSGFISPSGGMFTATTTVAWPWLTLLGLLYFTIPEALFGASPGKLLMRLRVVRLDGRSLGVGAVIVRNLLKPIDFLPLLYILGGVLVLITPGRQRLGDIAAGTTVVYRHRALEPGATRTSGRFARWLLIGGVAVTVLFTIGFDYFGRPPLVLQGLFNEHQLFESDVTTYTLGSPSWGSGQVSYPITYATATRTCTGTIVLHWQPFEWQLSSSTVTCSS